MGSGASAVAHFPGVALPMPHTMSVRGVMPGLLSSRVPIALATGSVSVSASSTSTALRAEYECEYEGRAEGKFSRRGAGALGRGEF